MTVQKQVVATVVLGSDWLVAAASTSVACSADGGARIVSCHHTMEIYGKKEAFFSHGAISGVWRG
jgi:peroxiredoxin family protein